ncbi:MAG: Glu/Leu/Phe/Val family dehydrogenase [Petrotogales bacterium]
MELIKFADNFGPEKVLEVYNPKTRLKGILVIDNTTLGPGKGGIRMTSTVNVKEVFLLARTMTWKCALAELSFGGAKAGIIADPKNISKQEKKKLIQSFSRALKPLCPSMYIAAPDMGTGEEEMKWFAEANGSLKSCTGKPADMCVKNGEKCGIPHEYGSVGFGVVHSTMVAIDHLGLDKDRLTAAIEGFGNVGSFTAKYLSEARVKLVAVSDSSGCIYNREGLDFKRLYNVKQKYGTVVKYRDGKILANEELFRLPVDVLIPAALSNVINEKNIGEIKAKIVIEAANIPMVPEIEDLLYGRGILVIPDLVANAGGVISSYAEYRGYNPSQLLSSIERKIKKNVRAVLNISEERGIKPRDAAMEIAKERVEKATNMFEW